MGETSYLLLATFRHPFVYTLAFDPSTESLQCVHVNEASGGHSWLKVSNDGKYLYTTVWSETPRVAAYRILAARESGLDHPTIRLIGQARVPFLSGYVETNALGTALYSASGPQCEVLDLDPSSGGFLGDVPKQSVSFTRDATKDDGQVLDFGGLRNGGHVSAVSLLESKHVLFTTI